MIQIELIHPFHRLWIKKMRVLVLGYIYPRDALQPLIEEYLLLNFLENTYEPHCIEKIASKNFVL